MRKAFKRYQLSYPFEGKKIYESRSLGRAVKKCYSEFINDSTNDSGNIFSVMDIDNMIEYNFRINDKNIYIMNTTDNLLSTQEPIREASDDKIIPLFNQTIDEKLDKIPSLKK